MTAAPIVTCPACGVESTEDYGGAGICWTCFNRQAGSERPSEPNGERPRLRLRLLDVDRMLSEPPPPVPWIVEPLLASGAVTMLAGKEGQGKSMLALSLAAGVLTGEELAGFRCEKGHVLYVDAENGDTEIARRLHGLDVPRTLNAASAEGFDLERDLSELERLVAELKPQVLVLDSFRSLCPGDYRGFREVEPAGIEPATSCLQSRRSPN